MVAHSTGELVRPSSSPPHAALPGALLCLGAAMVTAPLLAHQFWGGTTRWTATAALGGMACAGLATLAGLVRSYPHRRFGLCNALTVARAMIVAVLAALVIVPNPLAEPQMAWTALGLALAALALDGLDGWAARRAGLASAFGARFDMEVDTALALVLAVLVWLSGKVGVWVLALGLMRPAFVLAGLGLPRLRRPLPPALWRKTLCVVQIGTLALLLVPVVGAPLAPVLAALALGLVGAGFARDIHWLWHRP